MSRRDVSPQELHRIQQVAPQQGFDRRAICRELSIPYTRLDNILSRDLADWWRDSKRTWTAANGVESKQSRAFKDLLDVPVRPFAVPIPRKIKAKSGRWSHAVVYGDTHHPFEDKKAVEVVRGVIADVRPDKIVHLGDLVDCYTISKFPPNPARANSLQAEIDVAREHLHQVAQVAPNAEKLLLGGNHEDRFRRMIWELKGANRELATLRVFQKTMTWPALFELDGMGWDFVDYTDQPVVGFLPKLVLKHGDVARKWSGWSAKAEWEKHAKGGISGHTHRLGAFYHRDLNGSHVWNEAGCTCTMKPEYMRSPDWQQGCLVVAYDDERFQVETVYIQDGKALWRAKEYAA